MVVVDGLVETLRKGNLGWLFEQYAPAVFIDVRGSVFPMLDRRWRHGQHDAHTAFGGTPLRERCAVEPRRNFVPEDVRG